MRRVLLPKMVCILMGILLLGFLIAGQAMAEGAVTYDVVVSAPDGYCNLRSGPGTEYGVLTPVYNGEKLHVTGESYNYNNALLWGSVTYNGVNGWVSLSQTSKTEPDINAGDYYLVDAQVRINSSDGYCGLRSVPRYSSGSIASIRNGTVVYISNACFNPEDGLTWGQTYYNGSIGWIDLARTEKLSDGSQDSEKPAAAQTQGTSASPAGNPVPVPAEPVTTSTPEPVTTSTPVPVTTSTPEPVTTSAPVPVTTDSAVTIIIAPVEPLTTESGTGTTDIGQGSTATEYMTAYLDLLKANYNEIASYTWQYLYYDQGQKMIEKPSTPVVFCDVYGDDTPEMIYITGINTDSEVYYDAVLHIVAYENHAVKELYVNDFWDSNGAARQTSSDYYLFQRNTEKTLYVYYANHLAVHSYGYFEENAQGNLDLVDLYSAANFDTDPYPRYFEGSYSYDKPEIPEVQYMEQEAIYHNSISRVLMYNNKCDEFGKNYALQNGCPAMTLDDAIAWLTEQIANGASGSR